MLGTNHFKGANIYYKVLGYDKHNKTNYLLGYTYDKIICLQYHIDNGWGKEDITFIKYTINKKG